MSAGDDSQTTEVTVEKFVHEQNLVFLRKQLAETPTEARQLTRLLIEEQEKDHMSACDPKRTKSELS